MRSASELVSQLGLEPHPEGGWYREVHRSSRIVETARGPRAALTSIHYLLERGQLSRWHAIESDEIWRHRGGAPLELALYDPRTREFRRLELGGEAKTAESIDVGAGVVAPGVWQAARSLGEWSLVSCDVAPGFDFEDFRFVA